VSASRAPSGGRAAFSRATRDVDIVFATDHENCLRFAELLDLLDASIRMADLPAAGGRITPEWLAGGGHFVFGTVHGPLDALTWIAAEGASRVPCPVSEGDELP
jgi:hypothetical protein